MPIRLLYLFLFIIAPFIVLGQRSQRLPIPTPLAKSDTCTINAQKLFGGPGDEFSYSIIPTIDSGYILVGYTNSFGNGGYDAYVVKLDKDEAVQWSRTYGGPGDDLIYKGRPTSDGGYILGGHSTSYGNPAGDCWLVKIDAAGNLLWSRTYGDGNPYGERLFDLIPTSDGGYAFSGDHKYTPGIVDAMVVHTDANGNILWAKGFDSGGSDESSGINEDKDSIVVTSYYQSSTGYDAVLMKIETASGNLAWIKSWDFDGRTNWVNGIYRVIDGYLINGANTDGYGVTNGHSNVIKTDFNGNIIYVRELHPTLMNGYAYPTADSGYIVEHDDLVTNPDGDLYFTKVAKDGAVQWARIYAHQGQQVQAGIVPTLDGGYAGLSYSNQSGSYDLLLVKTDSLGETYKGCVSAPTTEYNTNPVVTNLSFSWPNRYDITFNANVVSPVTTSPTTKDSALCQPVSLCQDLHITGMDSICDWHSPSSYKAIRDPGCVTPVQWSIDNAYADIIPLTDSTVQLQFKQTGNVKLYGQITNTCTMLQDSIIIHILYTMPVSLGNPAPFCPGDSLVLDAGIGFQSYAWSNGETTQQLVVHTPGDYWVAAVDPNSHCTSGDTVTIGVYTSPVVNIGPDRSICRDSVYIFDAGDGFSSYLWQDGSSGSTFTASVPGAYWVKVTGQDGCPASDTARILHIIENPKNFLDPVDPVCSEGQQPVKVNAIGAWAQYLWSDSSTGPSVTIAFPGQYWLQVTSAAGCTARETITINGKVCPLGIFFPGAFTPNNDGNNDIFRAIVFSPLAKFHLAVFDRWGARVFETTDPYKGWDGIFNGHPQPSGTFVWYAQYRLIGQQGHETLQKGTLLLLR